MTVREMQADLCSRCPGSGRQVTETREGLGVEGRCSACARWVPTRLSYPTAAVHHTVPDVDAMIAARVFDH